MKILKIVLSLFMIGGFCASCGKTESSIKGVYINNHKGIYSIAWDTIIISKVDKKENVFQVENKTGFQRIRDGKLKPKEFKRKSWTADWNADRGAFEESLYYSPIRIMPGGLLLKSTPYQKIR